MPQSTIIESRHCETRPISLNDAIRDIISDMLCNGDAVISLNYTRGYFIDRADMTLTNSALIKLISADKYGDQTTESITIHGSDQYLCDLTIRDLISTEWISNAPADPYADKD